MPAERFQVLYGADEWNPGGSQQALQVEETKLRVQEGQKELELTGQITEKQAAQRKSSRNLKAGERTIKKDEREQYMMLTEAWG